APGTSPPPRTRSSSSTPVGVARAASTSISAIGRAAERTGLTAVVRGPAEAGPSSATVPHSWHSPQRPTHFAVVHPHALQRKAGREDLARERAEVVELTDVTLGAATDTGRRQAVGFCATP